MKQKHSDKFSDEQLIEQYNIEPNLSKIAVHFGVPQVTIWRRSKKLDLTYKHGGTNKKISLDEILKGLHPTYQTFKLKNRLLKDNIFENICTNCGITEWQDLPINLHLDHIDGNCSNHKLENLRLLCPNCHSQTDTWCGKNK